VSSIQQTILEIQQSVPAGDTRLVKWLTGQSDKLTTLANRQGQLITEITDAQQTATSVISGAGITSAYGYEPALAASNGPTASQSLITGMQQQLADTKSFASQLGQLQKMGLNATTESQLAGAGVSAGLPLAEGLAQGGKSAITQMNSLESQLIKAAGQIGDVAGPAMYTSGVQAAGSLGAGLKDELKDVDKDMSKITDSIISTVQHDLGAKAGSSSSSPAAASSASTTAAGAVTSSSVTGVASLGKAGAEAAGGLGRVGPAADAAASALGKITAALSPQGSGGGYGGAGSGGGTAHVTNHQEIHVHVQGSVMTENDLVTVVQQGLFKRGSNNWQVGVIPPGRHY
jgi:hypothetical protein